MGGAGPTALRGRTAELDRLRGLLSEATSGRLSLGIVQGEPGIGKTRLLEELLAEARRRNFKVFAGRAQELASNRQFGPLLDALGCGRNSPDARRVSIASELTTRRPTGIAEDPGLQFRVLEGFLELLEAEALGSPVALILEDIHWADLSTIVAVRSIVQRLHYLPIALLVSLRPIPRTYEVDTLLEGLIREGAAQLSLGPLDAEAIVELLRDILSAQPGPGLLHGVTGAAGNPLFINELTHALELEGLIHIDQGTADVSSIVLPPGLRLTIIRRIGFLSATTIDTLRACSILGTTFSLGDLAAITGRTAEGVYEGLRSARDGAVLLDEDGARLRFRHDLIRDAIYEDIPESLRVVLHERAGHKLAAAGAPAVQVAEQFERAGADAAAVWLGRAAREVGLASPAMAAELLSRAAAASSSIQRDQFLLERGVNLFWAGRHGAAEEVLREVVRAHPEDGSARSALAQALIAQDRFREALGELDEALRTGSDEPSIRALTGHCRLILGDLAGARESAETALAGSETAGDRATASIALSCLGAVASWQGDFTRAVSLTERAVAQADRSDGRTAYRFHVAVFHGLYLMDIDQVHEALSVLERGARITEELGARWSLAYYHNALMFARFLLGDWDEALVESETHRALADESGTRQGMERTHAMRAMILTHRDDLAAAAEAVQAAEEALSGGLTEYRFDWPLWARARLVEAGPGVVDAYNRLWPAWDRYSGSVMGSQLPILADVVRLAVEAGQLERAREVCAAIEDFADAQPSPWVAATAARCRALVEPDSDNWNAAVDAWRLSPRLLDRAATLEGAGTALSSDGNASEGEKLLTEALELYERLAAVRDSSRVGAKLRKLGVRGGGRGPRRRHTAGWESLTPSEIRVVPLIAEGLTNRQIADRLFVSPRTVQTHISHIFEKLGVSSRAEVASHTARRMEG
jgi:DNA-binding CsgD family transcriptional regulator/tetratricopeptide (TPR) repeat protein